MKAGTVFSKTLLGCFFFLILAGCGGGGGDSEARQDTTETEALAQGIFVDAGVSGLTYRSGPATGKTDASGTFRYQVVSGEPQSVSFFLGGIELGSAIGRSVLTPIDILGASSTSDPRVINLLRLLQTLDEDGNPDNGIVLSESVQAQFTADISLDLSADIFDGSEPLATIFSDLNKETTDIVEPEVAREHFENSVVTGTGRQLYTLGGAASGLLGPVSLVLGNETLFIPGDAQFRFIGKMFDDTAYIVSVADSGTGQTCGLTNASGRIDGRNVTNMILQCTADARDVYPVGGSVSGLSGELRLVNNDADELSITSDGAFQFTTPIASGSDFNVQVTQQPSGQLCSLSGASGTISDAGVSSVLVSCTNAEAPLNLVTSGIAKPFDVALQIDGVQRLFTLNPVSSGATLLPLTNVAVGASLDSLSFASLPTRIANCVLSDQDGLVTGGVLTGNMPSDETSLSAVCGSSVSVATATTGDSLIADSALRACIQASTTADQSWDSVTQLNCPYSGDGDQIRLLDGIERFVNLTEVNFNNHNISNLDPLLALLDLEAAFLANNPLTLSEREKLNNLDELNQTVFLSGSGTVSDAGPQFFDVTYQAIVEIEDTEIYVLSGQRKEFAINYSVSGCSDSVGSTFQVESKLVSGGDNFFLAQSCGFSGSSIFAGGEPFFSRETRRAEFDFIFGGNVDFQDLADQLYAEFEFVPVLIPDTADTLDELFFADADMAGCLADLVGSTTALVSDIHSLNLSECPTPPLDLSGIEQLVALESLDVDSLPVSSTGLLSELVFLDSFSRSTTKPLADVSWRNGIRDDQLLTCLDVTIAANFDENNAANSTWQNWEDVTRVECPSPVETTLFSSITDLSGIEQFEQLSSLTLPGHPVVDGIGSLRKLPVLTELELAPSFLFQDGWASSAGQSAASRRNPRYRFTLTEPQSVDIELASTFINPYLVVLDDSGNEVVSTDVFENLSTTVNTLLAAGTYEVVAATFFPAQTGSFEISANTELTPVLRKLKTPILADDPESPGTFGLSGTVVDAQEEPSLADVAIRLEMSQPIVFFKSGNANEIRLNVSATVERSEEGGGGSGPEQFVAYAYSFTVKAVNELGQIFSSAPRTCNTDFSEASIRCLEDIDLRTDIAGMALAPGEYKLTVDYEAVYDILERSSQTIVITAPLIVFPGCLTDESGALLGSFSSIDFATCPNGSEVDLSGIDMLSQLGSLNLSNMIVTAGMSDLLRVADGAEIILNGLAVDLSNSELLAEFIPDPTLRQCIGDNLPEFYDPFINPLTTLNCPGYGIYHLGGLEYLQTLRLVDLSDNLLEDDDVQVLKQLPLLAGTVDVTGNDLSFAVIADLQTYFAGGATFLPAGPAPVVPVLTLTTGAGSFEVSWVTDPTVTRYDLLYRFEGESFDRTVANAAPPVVVSFPDTAVAYEVQVVVTNDLGSANGTRVEGAP